MKKLETENNDLPKVTMLFIEGWIQPEAVLSEIVHWSLSYVTYCIFDVSSAEMIMVKGVINTRFSIVGQQSEHA